jgi:hypothetical protein
MHSLLLVLAAVSGSVSQESIREPEGDQPWVHHRSRLYLQSKSKEKKFSRRTKLLVSFEASGFVQYDAAEDPGEKLEARVENLFVRTYRGNWNTRIGWQAVTWGETLGPSVIDVINPRDLRDPSYWLRGNQKLAVPLVLVGWSEDSKIIDVWANPYAPRSLLPDEFQDVSIENKDKTGLAEFGARIGSVERGWDMKYYIMRHRSRTPAINLSFENLAPKMEARFPMQTSLGFTVSQAWDNVVFRGEAMHAESDDWPDGNLMDFARDQVVAGLDGTWGDHFFWGTELRYSRQDSLLEQDRNVAWIIAQGRWSLWQDRVRPLVYMMQRIQEHDAHQRYEVSGVFRSVWTAGLYWEAFQSSTQGYFARLQAEDRLGLTLQWDF